MNCRSVKVHSVGVEYTLRDSQWVSNYTPQVLLGQNCVLTSVVQSSKFIMHCPIGDGNTHTHTHTHKAQTNIKQETKMFHSLVSAMATKGATHPTTETVHVLPSSTMTQESGEECTGGPVGNVGRGGYPSRP